MMMMMMRKTSIASQISAEPSGYSAWTVLSLWGGSCIVLDRVLTAVEIHSYATVYSLEQWPIAAFQTEVSRCSARACKLAHFCPDYYSILDHFITIVKDTNSADGDSFALDLVHMYHIASHMSVHRRPSIPDDNSQLRTLFNHLLIGLRAQESNTETPPELTESCHMILSSLGSDNQDTGVDISQTLAEDLEVTWSSDDFALGRKQRTQEKQTKEKDAGSWLSDVTGPRRGTLPGDAVLASLAADLEGEEMLHSTPGRPSRVTRRQSTSSRPKIPPLLLRKDST